MASLSTAAFEINIYEGLHRPWIITQILAAIRSEILAKANMCASSDKLAQGKS